MLGSCGLAQVHEFSIKHFLADNSTSDFLRHSLFLREVTPVIIGVVVGAVVGTRHHDNKTANVSGASSGDDSSPSGQAAAASSAAAVKNAIGVYPTGTDSLYLLPLYPSTVSLGVFSMPDHL